MRWLHLWPDWPGPGLVLTGPPQSGKTTLAHMWRRRSGAIDISRLTLETDGPGDWLMDGSAVLYDDATRLIDDAEAQRAMFHIINMLMARGGHLLLVADRPVAQWRIALADLRSRLFLLPQAEIEPPDDTVLGGVLRSGFARRQLRVEPAAIDFLVARIERSFAAANALIAEIDREALQQRRNITIPFLRQILDRRSP